MSTVTVADLIEAAAARLRSAGIPKPRREANRLWAWQNRLDPGEAYLGRHRSTDSDAARALEAAVERRVRGEPLAYVLGQTGFRRLTIRCDRRALIPRPESEGVVDLALARCRTGAALDLGTGTGCLALALADEGAFSRIMAVDRSAPTLSLAGENVAATGLAVRLAQSDLGTAFRREQFDLVVTNPPYLTTAEFAALDASVREWEPPEALLGGPDGLDVVRRILWESRDLLAPGGWLVMEVDSGRAAVAAEIAAQAGWVEVEVSRDLFGRYRFLTARRDRQRRRGAAA
ncbi:MAG: peptide chain release factor N(5)-glutamine methyltransferase [Gemmatimonadales bacterium]